jgi:hypothetical protein
MIAYRDFAPQQTSPGGLMRAPKFEPFDHAVAAANAWIEAEGIDVVTIETVTLPNIWSPHEEGTSDPNISASPDFVTQWNQFVRVWYRA